MDSRFFKVWVRSCLIQSSHFRDLEIKIKKVIYDQTASLYQNQIWGSVYHNTTLLDEGLYLNAFSLLKFCMYASVFLEHTMFQALGLQGWLHGSSLCGCPGTALTLILCSCHFDILNNCLTRGLHFQFTLVLLQFL